MPPFCASNPLPIFSPHNKKKKEVKKMNIALKWEERWEAWGKKPTSNYQNWDTLVKREEVSKERNDGKKWKTESGGRMGEKMEGIRRGVLPYATTFSFPPHAIMIMRTMARFFYFNFVIILKWWSSIWWFRQNPNIFINSLLKLIIKFQWYGKFFFQNMVHLGHFAHEKSFVD